MKVHRLVLALLMTVPLLAGAPQVFAETQDAPGVPHLMDPNVLAQFTPMNISRFNDDPDFPLLLLARHEGAGPQFLLVIVDARNGKDTWSLREDAAVFCLVLAGPETIQRVFLDEGFASAGMPSGQFIGGGPEAAEELVMCLLESHRRSRGMARLGQRV